MLYAISGSQGQGKTTVINELRSNNYNIVLNQTSRSILKDWGYSLNEVNRYLPLTVKFQDEILKRHINNIEHAASGSSPYIGERSFADIFSYALFVVGPFNEYDNWLNEYFEKCKLAQKTYISSVFYLTGRSYKPANDGVRSINIHYAAAVDTLILNTLNKFDCNVIQINETDLNKRVDIIKGFL